MPTDDIVKRLNNLLQFKTALESTNVSRQYLSTETARRDAIKLEKQGNQIDPVTKKPKKYSEKYLQSTRQQIPGLDSDGVSAMNALDVVGAGQLAKVLGQLGKQGVKKALKDLTLKETISGSPVKLSNPSQMVKDENMLPFLQRPSDNVGELMNLGTKTDGVYNNRRIPISVKEWLQTQKNQRNYNGYIDDNVYPNNWTGGESANDWTDGFRIVDEPTQNRLPYFSKITDDVNKGLAERLAGKEVQLKVEPTNYGYRTQVKGKIGNLEYPDWRYSGSMTLNPSGNAITKGDMLLKPVTDAQNGIDAVYANSSFPFSNLPNSDALIGKGYGKELYRQLNASLKQEYGTRLNSGHNSLSEHSRALWNSLVDKGEAWRIGDPNSTVQYGLYGGLLGTMLANQKDK